MPAPTLTTGEIARRLEARLDGPGDIAITRLDALEHADAGTLAFIRSVEYANRWAQSRASAALVSESLEVPGHDPATRALLVVPDADLALASVLSWFAVVPAPPPGVHPSAVVAPTARIGDGASIGPACVVMDGASVAAGAVMLAQSTLGRDASIGAGTVLHPGVRVLDRCRVGARCTLHAGVVIGADGFGYRPAPDGRGVVKIPHLGNVEIGDDVEIGANSTIDRGKFAATRVGDGTKIDNLVQIAHNCIVGRHCLICGQSGLAGSVTLGDGVVVGARCAIVDNIRVGSGARIAAGSGVMHDIPENESWWGWPAVKWSQQARIAALVLKLPEMHKQLQDLARRLGSGGT